MPFIEINGASLHYDDSGGSGVPVLFSHGLLYSGEMFAAQVAALASRFRCITYDHRGQGRSAGPGGGAHGFGPVTAAAEGLIRALGLAPCHFVGLSMGGFVGMRLAARRPDLIRSLVLLETSADPEPPENVPRYRLLAFVARWFGLGLVVNRVMPIMFSRSFLTDPARKAERERWKRTLAANPRGIVRAVRGVIERQGIGSELGRITAPTLVVVGDEDVATVPAKAERIHTLISGSRLERVARDGSPSSVGNTGSDQAHSALRPEIDG